MMGGVVWLLLLGVVVVVVALLVVMATSRSDSHAMRDQMELVDAREELAQLRILVDDLRELAYEHRELDSALSVLMVDRIRTYERRGRELP